MNRFVPRMRVVLHRLAPLVGMVRMLARPQQRPANVGEPHELAYWQAARNAGVSEEDRALLLGHAVEGISQHHATATIARIVELANKVSADT